MKGVLDSKDQNQVRNTKSALAKKLGVSRGMLYYQHKRPVADEALKADIEEVMRDNPGYGHKRILRVMKKFHLMPKRRRKQGFIKPDDLGKGETGYINLIETFCPIRPNVVWVGDFTHIRFKSS